MIKTIVHTSNGKMEINSEMQFYVFEIGSGTSIFGENAKLKKVLAKNLVFETESGTIIKTELDTLNTVGKAEKNGLSVGIGDIRNRENATISKTTLV